VSNLWTYKELCEYLGCGIAHAKTLVKREAIPHKHVGRKKLVRFDPETIRAWVVKGDNGNSACVARDMPANSTGTATTKAGSKSNE